MGFRSFSILRLSQVAGLFLQPVLPSNEVSPSIISSYNAYTIIYNIFLQRSFLSIRRVILSSFGSPITELKMRIFQ